MRASARTLIGNIEEEVKFAQVSCARAHPGRFSASNPLHLKRILKQMLIKTEKTKKSLDEGFDSDPSDFCKLQPAVPASWDISGDDNGKINRFSLSMLVRLAQRAGLRPGIKLQKAA